MMPEPPETTEEKPRKRRRRTITVTEVIEFLEYISPPSLSDPEEPYGLQVGGPGEEVRSIVVSPMASFGALSTAAARKRPLLVTAAPLLTRPLMAIRRDDPIGSKLAYLVEHRISAYALANSIAAAPGGFDDKLAEVLGLAATSVLCPTRYESQYKMAVFVPPKHVDAVLAAAAEAGAGRIGKYSHCSFQSAGTGTFLPLAGAQPTIGSVGNLERVDEIRLEMVVSQRELQGVIAAVLAAHPYEEVAYDIAPIRNPGVFYGRGRIGELPLKVSPETVLAQVQDALGISSLRCSHRSDMLVGTLAVVSGRADDLVWSASRAGAGAIVMGGATPSDMMLAEGSATVIVDVGYKASVAPGLRGLCRQLQDTFAGDAEVIYTE